MVNFQNIVLAWLLILSAIILVLAATKEPSIQIPFSLASAESTPVDLPLCMDEATKQQIKDVMLEALDSALKNHIEHVFEVWLKDERGQPGRARTGVNLGIKSYLSARKGAMEWAPPPCSG